MKLSKFCLNRINFDCTKLSNDYISCFQQLVSIQKIAILHDVPCKIAKDIKLNTITLRTLIHLCIWKNCNVWIVINNLCFKIGSSPPSHIIHNNMVIPWVDQVYNYYFVLYPIHSLSYYKMDDLKQIAENLNLPISKTKKQLYNDIINLIEY